MPITLSLQAGESRRKQIWAGPLLQLPLMASPHCSDLTVESAEPGVHAFRYFREPHRKEWSLQSDERYAGDHIGGFSANGLQWSGD